jgi:hypothetical protein
MGTILEEKKFLHASRWALVTDSLFLWPLVL